MNGTLSSILIELRIIAILGITLYRKMEEGVFPIRCESVQMGNLSQILFISVLLPEETALLLEGQTATPLI